MYRCINHIFAYCTKPDELLITKETHHTLHLSGRVLVEEEEYRSCPHTWQECPYLKTLKQTKELAPAN